MSINNRSPRTNSGGLSTMEIDGNNDDDINFDELLRSRPRYVNPQRNSLPPRTTAWVLCMFGIGTILIMLGIGQYYDAWFGEEGKDGDHVGLSMICMGSFMFIPGSYATYVLFGAWNRWVGFSYSQIPNYGDEE